MKNPDAIHACAKPTLFAQAAPLTIVAMYVVLFASGGVEPLNAQSMPVGQISNLINGPELSEKGAAKEKPKSLVAASAQPCTASGEDIYNFNHWFPASGCSTDAVRSFFKVSGSFSMADTIHYLYSPNQSTNQVGADLFTATFRQGFQAILSGTATAGTSQPSGTSQGTTDSVSTAVSKLENGGDFNLRFPYPIYYHATNGYGVYLLSSPSVGFNVNGLTGQNTITESTEYNLNVPLEFYAQTASIETNGALLYVDAKPALEVVSPAFASAIGLKSNRYFFLGQAAAGLEFAKKVRVGFQYFVGPQQVYQVPNGTGTTTKASKVGGIHLVISFSPGK